MTVDVVTSPDISALPLSKSKTTPSSRPEKFPLIKTPEGIVAPVTEESVTHCL